MTKSKDAAASRLAPLHTPTDLKSAAVQDIAGALNVLLADMFALYLKTKNFHWHVSGPHFRDYHLLLDEQSDQNLRHHGCNRRACSEDRRHDPALDRPRRPPATRPGQRRGFRHALGHARRAAGRQQTAGGEPARDAWPLRRARRCGQREPVGKLDRRGRAAGLVSFRIDPRPEGIDGVQLRSACSALPAPDLHRLIPPALLGALLAV